MPHRTRSTVFHPLHQPRLDQRLIRNIPLVGGDLDPLQQRHRKAERAGRADGPSPSALPAARIGVCRSGIGNGSSLPSRARGAMADGKGHPTYIAIMSLRALAKQSPAPTIRGIASQVLAMTEIWCRGYPHIHKKGTRLHDHHFCSTDGPILLQFIGIDSITIAS